MTFANEWYLCVKLFSLSLLNMHCSKIVQCVIVLTIVYIFHIVTIAHLILCFYLYNILKTVVFQLDSYSGVTSKLFLTFLWVCSQLVVAVVLISKLYLILVILISVTVCDKGYLVKIPVKWAAIFQIKHKKQKKKKAPLSFILCWLLALSISKFVKLEDYCICIFVDSMFNFIRICFLFTFYYLLHFSMWVILKKLQHETIVSKFKKYLFLYLKSWMRIWYVYLLMYFISLGCLFILKISMWGHITIKLKKKILRIF